MKGGGRLNECNRIDTRMVAHSGGNANQTAASSRSAQRTHANPGTPNWAIGFRVVLSPHL